MTRLARLLSIEPGEGRLVAQLLACSFSLGLGIVLLSTAADTLFLVRFGTARLPWIYLSSAVLVPLCGVVYARLQSRTTERSLGLRSLGFLVVVAGGLYLVNRASGAGWAIVALRLFVEVANALVALTFWGPVGSLLDIRQAKRLYGLIGNGEVVAGIVGGLAVVPLCRFLNVRELVLGSGLAFSACLAILVVLSRGRSSEVASADGKDAASRSAEEPPPPTTRRLFGEMARDRYALLITLLFLFYYVAYELLVVLNLSQMETRFGENPAALASFLGTLAAVRTAIILVVRTFATGRLLDRFGLSFGLLSLPIVQITATLALVPLALLLRNPAPLFWAVVSLALVEGIVRTSLNKPAVMVLYRPMAPARRAMTQTVVETLVDPAGSALAGGLLLVLTAILAGFAPGPAVAVRAGALLVPLTGLLLVTLALRRAYSGVVLDALSQGHLKGTSIRLDEREAIPVAEARLQSPDAREVLVAMRVLENVGGRERLIRSVTPLLHHERAEVRRRALEIAEQETLRPLGVEARARLEIEREPAAEVRAAAARAVGAVEGEGAVDLLARVWESDEEPRVRRAAHVALLRYGGLKGALQVGARTRALLDAGDPDARVAAAELLGDAGVTVYAYPLRHLLADPEPRVRRAALVAAGRVRDPALWPSVIGEVGDPSLGVTAVRALRAGGDAVVPMLNAALHDPATPLRAAVRLAFTLGDIGGPGAQAALLGHMDHAIGEVRREVLAGLRKCRYRADELGRARVETRIETEVKAAAWIAGALVDVGAEPGGSALLVEGLRCELDRARDRVVSLLSFLYRPQPLLWVRRHLRTGSAERKAYALEVLSTLTGGRVRELVFPLFEGRAPAELHARLFGGGRETLLGRAERLRQLQQADHPAVTPWLRAAAVHGAAFGGERNGMSDTLLTIERVILLKSTDFFSTIDDDLLGEVAQTLQELRVPPGTRVIEAGDSGSSLYVVASGEVRVHDGAVTLRLLGPKSVFGDLSALDPDERTVSVTATADTVLLQMEHSTLMDVMEEHIEVAHGIIKFLVRRFRAGKG